MKDHPADLPFDVRLEIADRMLDRMRDHPEASPSWVNDQTAAATDEAWSDMDAAYEGLARDDPGRHWRRSTGTPERHHQRVFVAAVLGLRRCPHLAAPQPVVGVLPLRLLACKGCAASLPRQGPAGEDDRCDICGTWGVTKFYPVVVTQGPCTLVGDVCPPCHDLLRASCEAT